MKKLKELKLIGKVKKVLNKVRGSLNFSNIQATCGSITIASSIILAIYVGFYRMFLLGIAGIVGAVQDVSKGITVVPLHIALDVAKILTATPVGVLIAYLGCLIGLCIIINSK